MFGAALAGLVEAVCDFETYVVGSDFHTRYAKGYGPLNVPIWLT
jgi:hypothetical protein